nr:retrovirus-related Pol polyprotein from transposon TNT 1-94 [Tanacetum cinerariifolium]
MHKLRPIWLVGQKSIHIATANFGLEETVKKNSFSRKKWNKKIFKPVLLQSFPFSKKNDVKARSMLLMALPNDHLMTINQYKDAKSLFDAITTRFGGDDATRKTQKTLLKQMYENFSAQSTESLNSIFNRLQKIVSQLAVLGEIFSQEDLNLKFLRVLPSEWNTHVVVWRNKSDLDKISIDDLYNNFKIIKQEGRMIEEIDEDENVNLVKSSKQLEAHETAGHIMESDETEVVNFSTASLQKDNDEIILAKTLVNIKKSVAKDKGKAIMQDSEPPKKIKKKEMIQIGLDEEIVQRFYKEEQAQLLMDEEYAQQVQAKWIQADEDLAQRMLEEDRESMSIKERSRLLTKFIDQRKKMLAAKRAEEKRNKPPTQAQQRTYMSNYIKNIGGYTLKQLKQYSFEEIKMLFDRTMESIIKFVLMERDGQIADSKTREESSKEGIHDKALQTKYLIVDWEIYTKGTRQYWKIIRVGNITEERFSSSNLTEDKEIALWVELKRLFELDKDDELWKIESFELIWRLYDWCGVYHISTRDGQDIFMLVEKERTPKKDLHAGRKTKKVKCLEESSEYKRVNSRNLKILREITSLREDCWELNVYILSTVKTEVSTANTILVLLKVIQERAKCFSTASVNGTIIEGSSTPNIPGPVTSSEKIQKKNFMKGKSMLLMALPNEHLMTINQYKDAKSLFDAITTRFGVNDATKKTQKTLLKQMYENFSAQSIESLDSIFNRLQKIVSQLAILGESISHEDLNMKFLKIMPSEWNTHVVVWRNKSELDKISIDDLNNNFKIVEQEVKRNENRTRNQETTRRTVNVEDTSSKAMVAIDGADFDWSYMADDEAPTNMAFMAFLDSENVSLLDENIVVLKRDILNKDSEITVLKSKLEMISKENDDIEIKIKKFENASQSLDKLIGSQITNKSNRSLRYVSYNAILPPYTGRFTPPRIDLSYIDLLEFAETSVESYGFKPIEVVNQTFSVKIFEPVKENNDAPLIEDWESEGEDEVESPPKIERKTVEPSVDKVEVDIPKQNDKSTRRPVKYAEKYRTQRPRGANTIKGKGWANKGKAVKASACWVWRPIKLDSASIVLKKHTYINAQGRSKSEIYPTSLTLGSLMEGMLHFREELEVAEAVNIACYVQNRILVVKHLFKTFDELFRGRTPAFSFMRPFGCHVTILNTLDHLGKFDGKSDEGIFISYSTNSKAFRVYNIRTRKVEENLHINFLENKLGSDTTCGSQTMMDNLAFKDIKSSAVLSVLVVLTLQQY